MKGLSRSMNRGAKRAAILRQVQKINNLTLSLTDPGSASAYGSVLSGMKLPEGNILLHGMMAQLIISTASADVISAWTGNIAIGSTATADATLTGTDINMAQVTAITAVSDVSPLLSVFSSGTQGGNIFDNTDKQLTINLNMNVADASIAAAADMIINGHIIALFTIMGDD